jgi:hypothetical protein
MNNLTENNRLIAEFMEWEQTDNNMFDFPDNFNDCLTLEYHCISPDLMKFHSDWNWLMEVVEKILNICSESDEMERYYTIIDGIPSIESVYECCIEFILWYNNQTK